MVKTESISRFIPIIWIINLIRKQYQDKKIDSVQMQMLLQQVCISGFKK